MERIRSFSSSRIPLLGAITKEVRAVAIKWDDENKYILLRYYFSSLPSEDDRDMVSDALGEIESHYWSEIERSEYECIYSLAPVRELDPLDGWLFLKKES